MSDETKKRGYISRFSEKSRRAPRPKTKGRGRGDFCSCGHGKGAHEYDAKNQTYGKCTWAGGGLCDCTSYDGP